MDANENSYQDYCFSLRELQSIATDNVPDSVSQFLDLLALRARNALKGETFQRQNEQEQMKDYKSE
jgi:hypothetical protein